MADGERLNASGWWVDMRSNLRRTYDPEVDFQRTCAALLVMQRAMEAIEKASTGHLRTVASDALLDAAAALQDR